MALVPGARLGAYEITGTLGAGGMGEVYRARDTGLGREAAIKILPADVAMDPERMARFEREARTLASLNHANIAQVYGFEYAPSGRALVMELVGGEDLANRLSRGPIPLEDAIPIARQIADALETAHEAGIVHRDLKPANVRVRQDGTVKVLDFGIAKTVDAAAADTPRGAMDTPTFTSAGGVTAVGMILGTAAYMAPEQARGKAADKRADIWAFGVLLYEMLTGRRLFDADTPTETIAAVLTRDPDYESLPRHTPAAVRIVLRRCLERDVRLRLRDIGEARIALSTAGGAPLRDASVGPSAARRWPLALPWAVTVAVITAAGVLWAMNRRSPPPVEPVLTLGMDAGGDTPLAGAGWVGLNWVGPTMVLSPDGQRIAFIARGPSGGPWQLYLRRLDELKARALPGTDGAYAPFFSPDGRSIAFFANGHLSKVALADGTVTTLCPAQAARGGSWAPNGTIVFAPDTDKPLFRVSADGGTPTPFTTLDAAAGEVTHRWPQVLPDGTHVLFTICPLSRCGATGSRDASTPYSTIAVQSLAGGDRTTIQRGGLYARYAPSGHLLYVQDGKLVAAPFDVRHLQLTGRATAVVDDVAYSLINGTGQFSFSDTGLLAYRRALDSKRMLQWIDFAGQFQSVHDTAAEYQELRFSPDGNRMLLVASDGAQSDVWVYDIPSGRMSRVTFYADNDWSPIWSPDGSAFAYASWMADTGTFNLFVHRADGTGEPQRLTTSKDQQLPVTWHPSGKALVYTEDHTGNAKDLMLLSIERTPTGGWRTGPPSSLIAGPADESSAQFSPDGKWLAYVSNESGRSEVYVQPFPATGSRWQVSTEGAEWIDWNKQLMYGRSEEVVMSVPYRVDGGAFIADRPRVWMRIPPGVLWLDPAPDGTRAAVIRSADIRRESMVLFVNFFDYLRRTASGLGR